MGEPCWVVRRREGCCQESGSFSFARKERWVRSEEKVKGLLVRVDPDIWSVCSAATSYPRSDPHIQLSTIPNAHSKVEGRDGRLEWAIDCDRSQYAQGSYERDGQANS